MTEQIAIAKAIATVAHQGQTDKAGVDYIQHPDRVRALARVGLVGEPLIDTSAAAWLHDVLEDTAITEETLLAAGVSHHIVRAVKLLTRQPHQPAEEYYAHIRSNSIAFAVKLADIQDNTDPGRLAMLDDETIVRLTRKYAKARELLGVTG